MIRLPYAVYQNVIAGNLVDHFVRAPALPGGSYVPGLIGDALANNQDVAAGDPGCDLTGDLTLAFFAKPPSDGGMHWILLTSGGRLSFDISPDGATLSLTGLSSVSAPVAVDSDYHHYAATRTAAGVVKLYQDGVQVGSGTLALGPPSAGIGITNGNQPAEQFVIGEFAANAAELLYIVNAGAGRDVATWETLAPLPTVATLEGAIHAWWASSSALVALLPVVRVFTGRNQDDDPDDEEDTQVDGEDFDPYCTINREGNSDDHRTNCGRYDSALMRFQLWHTNHAAGSAIAQAIIDCFDNQEYTKDGVHIERMRRSNDLAIQEDDGVWQFLIDFSVLHKVG